MEHCTFPCTVLESLHRAERISVVLWRIAMYLRVRTTRGQATCPDEFRQVANDNPLCRTFFHEDVFALSLESGRPVVVFREGWSRISVVYDNARRPGRPSAPERVLEASRSDFSAPFVQTVEHVMGQLQDGHTAFIYGSGRKNPVLRTKLHQAFPRPFSGWIWELLGVIEKS